MNPAGRILIITGLVTLVIAVVLALTVGAAAGAIALVVAVSDIIIGFLLARGIIGSGS